MEPRANGIRIRSALALSSVSHLLAIGIVTALM